MSAMSMQLYTVFNNLLQIWIFKNNFFSHYNYLYMCVSLCTSAALRGQETSSKPFELEFQVVVRCLG